MKPMLACKFHFIFYFYLPLKLCNFNYSNLLLLINNSFDIRHSNHQSPKAKCLFKVIFFLYSIGYLDHSAFPHFCWGLNFQKGEGLTGSQFLVGVAGKERGGSSFYIKNK